MKIERLPPRHVFPLTPSPDPRVVIPLSSSDLAIPRVHVEVVYGFPAAEGGGGGGGGFLQHAAQILQDSLSQVLCSYREWAGSLLDAPSSISCSTIADAEAEAEAEADEQEQRPSIVLNDAGVLFMEASADGPLWELPAGFKPSQLLVELAPLSRGSPYLLLVQVTRFTCGGLTLGIARHHQVADGEAASDFMNAWAQIARRRGVASSSEPDRAPDVAHHRRRQYHRDRSALMPRDPPTPVFDHIEYAKKKPWKPKPQADGELAMTRVNFSAEMLEQIKARAASSSSTSNYYSRFVSLLAHLWRCITRARGLDGDVETRVLVAVNVRRRLDPPIPPSYFGNAMCHACASEAAGRLRAEPLSHAAALIDAAIKRVTDSYVRSALDFVELCRRMQNPNHDHNCGSPNPNHDHGASPNPNHDHGASQNPNHDHGASQNPNPQQGPTQDHRSQTQDRNRNQDQALARSTRSVLSPDLSVTSWLTLPLFELDFGWGPPSLAGNPFIPFEGLVMLTPPAAFPARHDLASIDVALGLFAPDMARFEATCFDLDA